MDKIDRKLIARLQIDVRTPITELSNLANSSPASFQRRILVAIVKDMKDYEAFTHRFFLNDENVRRFRTSIVVSREKATLSVPVDHD